MPYAEFWPQHINKGKTTVACLKNGKQNIGMSRVNADRVISDTILSLFDVK